VAQRRGVRIRGSGIVIDFTYRGIRCRETLKLTPNDKNIKYAQRLKDAIELDIERGTFEYTKYFTRDKLAVLDRVPFSMIIEKQLATYESQLSSGTISISTYKTYVSKISYYIEPHFGKKLLSEVTGGAITKWLYSISRSRKTLTNLVIPLNTMLKYAVNSGLIDESPLDKINLSDILKDISKPKIDEIEPFSNDEKSAIINGAAGQFKNLVQFNFWTGLRIGELIALRWADIDFAAETISINKSIIYGIEKAPKTKAGVRAIRMLPQAKLALENQFGSTGAQFDYVFHCPTTDRQWSNNLIAKWWARLLQQCGVKYRYPYQMRHTYASTLIAHGENLAWIATQLGHKNIQMVMQHYGRFIPDKNAMGGYQLKGSY
jgi:integrase